MTAQPIVRTRMAPSPTGEIHVGSMAMLLKNYAYAKKHKGQFILRIEDTDQTREVPGAVGRMLQVIKAYGLAWDEGPDIGGSFAPYTQSERLPLYREHALQLVAQNQAYYCFCSRERLENLRTQQMSNKQQPKYDHHCRELQANEVAVRLANHEPAVIRLKVPKDEQITFTDLIRGPITVSSNDVDDQVLLKTDGFPTYHLAVVVDDNAMHISHILRGEEWISSTPKHIFLYKAFGWQLPIFAHIPIFLNPDGKGKMSKRKGDVSAQSFLDQGYLPEAVLNFFMILGWGHPEQTEVLTLAEYIKHFDPAAISSKSVVFDLVKLQWLNGVYIRALSPTALLKRLEPFIPTDCSQALATKLLPLIHERLTILSDFEKLTAFFYRPITPDSQALLKQATPELVQLQLRSTIAALTNLSTWDEGSLETAIRGLQEATDWKKRQYFMLLRLVVSGEAATPPLFTMLRVLGKKLTLERLRA
ncbi:MAG: glutamate--tRNA ligase [Candidatus Pacebacteria bacterium RIFCSPHIGHO2_01_FULL_46_16]|nr:MAG: glutamate--tRNA ligase [Candidatus Pacebacteria bacterium RIFCSPHIGHO2_01_FULL_46_16]OGJ20158.1 MAG: glutamate--tRNA ligase [Candidatus Pacebacteria bacterium RIFCSPHIGHO2_02_FULL_46_9]